MEYAYEVINVGNVAVGFTSANLTPPALGALPRSTSFVRVIVLGNPVMCLSTGSNPTASSGEEFPVGSEIIVNSENCGKFRAISKTSLTAQIACFYHCDESPSYLSNRKSSFLGVVGGDTFPVDVPPIMSSGTYSNNDIIGGLMEIPNAARYSGGTGILQSITVIDKGKKNVELGFYVFRGMLSGVAAYLDNAAEAITAADSLHCIGYQVCSASDYKTLTYFSIGTVKAIGWPYKCALTSLYVIVRVPTVPGVAWTVGDLQFRFGLLRD